MRTERRPLNRWSVLRFRALTALAFAALFYALMSFIEHGAVILDQRLAVQAIITGGLWAFLMRWFDTFNFGRPDGPPSGPRNWYRD